MLLDWKLLSSFEAFLVLLMCIRFCSILARCKVSRSLFFEAGVLKRGITLLKYDRSWPSLTSPDIGTAKAARVMLSSQVPQ